jgi:putative endonuclease
VYYVYILTNKNNKVLYIGVTNNLERRLYEHKNKLTDGFTKEYSVCKPIYFEAAADINAAIAREKQLKGWTRQKKVMLIEGLNPEWKDLSLDWE